MKQNTFDRLRAIASKAATHQRTTIAGLPEFEQIIPPAIVAEYFKAEPKQRQYYVDKVAHKFNAQADQLNEARARFNKEQAKLISDHRDATDAGDQAEADRISATIHERERHFVEREAKLLNLAKGSALVVANSSLEELEKELRSGARTLADKEAARLRNMNEGDLLREQITLLKEVSAKLSTR